MELIKLLESTYRIIELIIKFRKENITNIQAICTIIGIIIFGTIPVLFLETIFEIMGDSGPSFMSIMIILYPIILLYTVRYAGKKIEDIVYGYVGNIMITIVDTINQIDQDINKVQNIDEIIKKLHQIQKLIRKLKKIQIIFKNGYGIDNELIMYMKELINWCQSILLNLKKDLIHEIKAVKKTIRSTKKHLKNIEQHNEDMKNISLLQSARLDRQIEQFEELQRVLVKV